MTESLKQALNYLRERGPAPMRVIAKGTGITPQAMACRVFRLRAMGLAEKLGPELYDAIREPRSTPPAGRR